jgi:hypothetical protein
MYRFSVRLFLHTAMKKLIKNCGLFFLAFLTVTTVNAQHGEFDRHSYRSNDFRRSGPGVSSGIYNRETPGGYRNNYYNGGYRNIYTAPPAIYHGGYSPYYGPRYYGVPRGSISLTFGGNPYYYLGGSFYRPFEGYYRSVFPPIGLQIGILPPGYQQFYMDGDPYYFYNGSYYRPYQNNSYEVVDAPMGAQLRYLPDGAKQVVVNGETFYELNGTYYKEDTDSKGNTVYTVAGKHGEINNSNNEEQTQPSVPKVGDAVSELPANTRTITLNGETLYVSPDDTYYRAESDGSYTVVGVAGSNGGSGN